MTPQEFQQTAKFGHARMARELGISRMTWYRWLRGRGMPVGRLLPLALDGLMIEVTERARKHFNK